MQENGELDEAEAAYRETLEHAEGSGDEYLISLALNSLGSVFLERRDFPKAEEYFLRSMETSRGMNRRRGILVSLLKLVQLELDRGDYLKSLDLSGQAEIMSRELGDKSLLCDILKERSRAYEMSGDHESAYSALSDYLEIHQEQLSEKRVRQIDVLRLYYETEVRDREIEKLSLTNRNLTRAYSRAEELTRTDALTGLANRRAALEWLSDQQDRYESTGLGFGLILSDIDGFKSCNDRFGHDCGDAVLVQLSARMRENLRKGDLAVRWGGEEFLILLPETDIEEAAYVAESLRVIIEEESFTVGNENIRISMTFGVCQGGEMPVDEVIRKADQAMYRGKHLGRNRVEKCTGL
jgi:diguanylate cyclase (GGDEF)-like protein